MVWKKSITDVKIICKRDGAVMVEESNRNLTGGLFVCPKCNEHINLKVNG